jgi:hypothetical protein
MQKILTYLCFILLFFTASRSAAQKEFVQRILLDKSITAGPLKVFPALGEDNAYYYLPNKLRLAVSDNGTPEFSFIKFVQNVRSGGADREATVGEGGGYVHVLVALKVTEEELQQARQELIRLNPRGKIIGPVIYRGGTMSLVTKSMLNEGAKKVLGIGAAPVLEGDKIAVSFLLNKEDATLLWESLKTPTPDLSFNLNMTIGGYQSPVEFSVEMEFDKIYQHKNFNTGVATPFLAAEIGIMAQELKESGAIKVQSIGEDANLHRMQDVITNKLIDLCFQPFGSQGSVNWADLAKPNNDGKSYLDRATEQLNTRRTETREENARITENNRNERDFAAAENRRIREENNHNDSSGNGSNTTTGEVAGPVPVGSTTRRRGVPPGIAATSINDRPREIPAYRPNIQQTQSAPSLQVVASYQQKSIHHSGTYKAEAKSYFTTSLTEVFGGNIGKINCKSCLVEVNLDDPLYKQREIVAWIDGITNDDFGKYINYVTVTMRKKHPGGDITTDEVRIDRKNFNKEGNNFKLMYGWMPGDNDRRTWMDYEYKTTWSFFGGGIIENDWKANKDAAIPLAAPVERRQINIMADQGRLTDANVRAVTVKVYYTLAGEEQVKQVSLNPAKQLYSSAVEIMLPKNVFDYSYEVEYLLNNNQTIKAGKKVTSTPDLFVDVLPNA